MEKAKQNMYDEQYERFDVRVIKDRDGKLPTSEESVRRWKEYFQELTNEEKEREEGWRR